MNSFRKSNLQNIKNIFEEKTGVELESTPVWRYPIKKYVVIAAVLVCSFTMTAFAASLFSSLSGDDLSLSSTYEGNGIVSIQVENKSDKDLNFQKQLKLMRWSTSEEIAPLSDNIIFENTEIKANTIGTMTIDLSAAYDFSVLEQPLVDDHYYFVLTNNNFLFGQDWMCSIEFTEPIITPIQEPTPINPVEADKVSVSKVAEKLQHYFDTYIADPLEWQARNEEYLSDCAQLLNDLDGNVVPSVAPNLLVDMFADSFVHVTDVLKGDFSITRIKAEPCEITMYQALDFLLEARRRNLMESTNRLIEASNLWIYNYYNNENLSFHYNFEERIVSDKSCANALYDQSFINELKNIEEHENASDFRGNMVHYVISGRSNEAVRDMAETLIQNLIKANRVSSRRLELITEIEPDMYSARNYLEDIIDGNFGGAIVIDLTEKVGCDPVDYTLVSKYIINLLKKYRNECLFIFTYNMDNLGFSYQILPEIEKYVVPVMLVIRELDDD